MSGDARKEIAAAGEPPGGRRGRLRLTSYEFFFLLQRIDRLDEKLTGEVKALDERVNARIDRLDEKINALNEKINSKFGNLTLWMVGTLVTIIVGFVALLLR